MGCTVTPPDRLARAAVELAEALGGRVNLARVGHCVTRLRLDLVERGRVDETALRAHPAVLGLREDDGAGGRFQVWVGPAVVADLAAALDRLLVEGSAGPAGGDVDRAP